jgi:hypothetical protein
MLRTFTVYPGDFLIRKYVGKFKMYPKNVPTVFLGGSFKVFFAMSPVTGGRGGLTWQAHCGFVQSF